MARPATIDHAAVTALLEEGFTAQEIARAFRIGRASVHRIADCYLKGSPVLRRLAAERAAANAARVQQAREARQAKRRSSRPVGLQVPAWATAAGLEQDYRDLAEEFDEIHAARECRKLLAEQRRQEAFDARLGRAA